jgi:hypothetical protein
LFEYLNLLFKRTGSVMLKSLSWIATISAMRNFGEHGFAKLQAIAASSKFPIAMIVPLVLSSATAAHAQFGYPLGSSTYNTAPHSRHLPRVNSYGRTVIIQRPITDRYYLSLPGQSFSTYRRAVRYPSRFSSPYPFSTSPYPSSTIIVRPNARTRNVIIGPNGFYNGGFYKGTSQCSTAIYGSPIPSPIPVNPYTGLACR